VREWQDARNTKALLRFEYPEGGFNDMMTRHEAAAVIGIEYFPLEPLEVDRKCPSVNTEKTRRTV
jgi:hypothetical protein